METIEKPMKMNYRESYAWQLGYDMGWKQAKEMIKNEPFLPVNEHEIKQDVSHKVEKAKQNNK